MFALFRNANEARGVHPRGTNTVRGLIPAPDWMDETMRAQPRHTLPRHTLPRRSLLTLGLAVGLAAATGCTMSEGRGTAASRRPSDDSIGPIDRRRIAKALGDDSLLGEVITDPSTTIASVPAAALGSWRILDVKHNGENHPLRWFIGVDPKITQVVVLSGFPERWSRVLDGASVTDAGRAVELAVVHSEATRSMTKTHYRVESVDQIPFTKHPKAASAARIAEVKLSHRKRIRPPAPVLDERGWTLELWTVNNQDLNRHTVTVGRDGSIIDEAVTELSDLPTPIGI